MTGYAPPCPPAPRLSRQLTRYLQFRQHGHARADAATAAGIPIPEAELVDKDMGL
ncbi:hypothetical protein [Sandarakinorhabdus sp. DWP1-3-1]|uniref:hypothetical protein n=1 Tax=Sandarakinorhabdus sp. DWP1-3-1 TaxID=2804627 RepID=UPI003CEA5881